MGRRIADTLSLRVLIFVLLGFGAVAVPAYFAFNWVINSTVIQLGTLFAEKQVLYDRHRGLGALVREVSLAETLAGSQAIRDWARDEDNPVLARRGIAELEHFRQNFADHSYFFTIDASGHYYFNDAANAYAGDQLRYAVDPENPRDAWYFSAKALGEGCHLNVDNDANLRVTKVWMNCVIREGQQVLGVLGTGIDLTNFIQEVVNVPQRGVISMFVDRRGQVQAHRDENLVSLASLSSEMSDKRTVYSLVESEADRDTLRQLFDSVTGGETLAQSAFVTINGKRTLVGVGYLDRLGWYNVTLMDLDAIIDRRLFLPIGLLLVAVMVLLAGLAMFVFKRAVLDRVKALEGVVRSARGGNYGPALSMGTGRQDEIGRLAASFTEMAAAVDDHTRLLETRVRERTRELERLAFRDGQTGILNRRGFQAAHADASALGPYGLLLVDIDRFKATNDNFGHAAGDMVVLEVARRIAGALGPKDSCARWGGDEFIVLLPECDTERLRGMAHAVMLAIDENPVRIEEARDIAISVSAGACLAEMGDALEVATDMADTALYMAKARGRNMVVVFDESLMEAPRSAKG
ncbi:diguanylate cyclase (GGDEF)-like protein [Devosia subaequoris]|uniref:diguanylate cyclase n=1 Tax=Devosia subaequoris TaxID=395930 RepID=A0A7W6NCC9_9HYPH|nr:sensor domain-containing diguanylate cyclase [Devosia subaequoris]MBB4052601.1 diguanylate cyclase (GGDEF)-like protein [Devosia subaequoris]MCP1209757.1 diguanylate cyclase [Devosia subaequoris]